MIGFFLRLPFPLRAGLVAACASLVAAQVSLAQTISPEDQLRIFQGLSPDQQSALLERLNDGDAGVADDSQPGARPREAAAQRPRTLVSDVESGALQPDDEVIVELAFPGTMSRGSVRSANAQDPDADTAPRRIRPSASLDSVTAARLQRVMADVHSGNPYHLDREGHLNLPGLPPILLHGLTEEEAVQKLSVDPALLQLDVSFQRLPVRKPGAAGLKPYGYDVFDGSLRLSPAENVPVPADYIIGPGDELIIQLFGSENRNRILEVTRDGTLRFPELGPIRVQGLTFSQARSLIENRVAQQMIGVRANVSVGDTRSITIMVMGEVRQRGTHAVPGLATMITALYAAGGVTRIGSLRDVQLVRQGRVVRRLDLYKVLTSGNTVDDARLQEGDVVFIPAVGDTVSIIGEVRRPAIYELQGETTAGELLQMAGGLTPDADPTRSRLQRIDEQYQRIVLDLNLASSSGGGQQLRNGDELGIPRLAPQLDLGVTLSGHVHRSGPVAWRPGMRLTDVLTSVNDLRPGADAAYVLVRRESGPERRVEILSADLVAALAQRGGAADLALQPRDQITVFDQAPGRERILAPLIEQLRVQSGLTRRTEVVSVKGSVRLPGEYPLEPGMTISDLLRAGGGLNPGAVGGKLELTRSEIDQTGTLQSRLVPVDLAALLRGETQADFSLQPLDHLEVRETPEWSGQETVTLGGEVRFPGVYRIRRGESLYSLLQQAGGLTSRAFPKGSVFTREYLRENEQKEKERQAERLQSDLVGLSLQAAAAGQGSAGQAAIAASQSVLTALRQSEPTGRMVIDLPALLADSAGGEKDVILRDGDVLLVPIEPQQVTVLGEVQNTNSHRFTNGLTRDDYIRLSGGTTRKADRRQIYVVRADGSVMANSGSLMRRGYDLAIQPGDTIVVPLNTERLPSLPFWTAVTGIIYSLAVTAAAINSF